MTSSSARDAVRCRDHLGHRVHDPEDLLDRRDLDPPGHRILDLHQDHLGAGPFRDDRGHPVDPHLGSSDATDRRCRPVHDRVHSAEYDLCVHRCHRDADRPGLDPSADVGLHRDDGNHQAVEGSDDRCQVAAESDDHSVQDEAMDHPAADAAQQAAGSVAVQERSASMARCAPNRP